MSSFNLEVVLEFIDRLTGPAKAAAEQLQSFAATTETAEARISALGTASEASAKLTGEAFGAVKRDILDVASATETASNRALAAIEKLENAVAPVEKLDRALKSTSQSAASLARELAALERSPEAGSAVHAEALAATQARLSQQVELEKRAQELHQSAKMGQMLQCPPPECCPQWQGLQRALKALH